MPEIDENKLYSISEAAPLINMSESTMRRRIQNRNIDYIYDGIYKIPGKSLIKYLKKHYFRAKNN